MPIPFTPPDFLQNQDEEKIYQRMKSNVPADLDTSEGSFFWCEIYFYYAALR